MALEFHNIEPVYDENSKILILGSFPSVKSRETGFFYGHPQNRFWRVVAAVRNEAVPETIAEKKAFLLRNGIAVWDVIKSCDITGSGDSSIKNAVPNDISVILKTAPIERIFCNGATSYKLYKRFLEPETGMTAVKLPSTSPANAAYSLDRLIDEWKI
ncbi:MAG TPA: DNA-deoxyinosine glycosylase [Candidatus Ornithomonoglobus merdipullorum]|uniref:DNA-deoxyinosine glycosylase n=1 Tax=Candidatus Ornithomonoglobus merdipullorum TaxID=2840895 RepID=A0A9D1M9N4_9FIRM|nr:DNA-deoxyinosine glycosylase [Candidatus Ornithomonoglobus merdipullorum]